MHKHERLAKLIAQDMKPKQAIALVGISESYFNRLKDTEDFQDLLRKYVIPQDTEHSLMSEQEHIEDKWSALEAQALNTALSQLPLAEMKDVNRTLDILAKRKVGQGMVSAAHRAASNPKIQLVTLRLPEHTHKQLIDAQAEIVTTSENEVIKAGERELAPMSTDSVAQLLEKANPRAEISVDDL